VKTILNDQIRMTNEAPNPDDQSNPRGWSLVIGHLLVILVWSLGIVSCDRQAAPTTQRSLTVASLVPAATDLLLGMGAGDKLVAVSNWDPKRSETATLPRVGDYRTIDWEKIAQVHPSVLIVQYRADKMPAGLMDRTKEMGIRVVNVKINRLDDVFTEIRELGDSVNEPQKAAVAEQKLRDELDAVRQRVKGLKPVRTLISRDDDPLSVVGGGNFMDDLLTLAGGKNVIETGDNSYPTIDKERLAQLDPDVVLQVLPEASRQVLEKARQAWQTMPRVSAVEHDRIYMLTDGYLLLPGYSVGKIASTFADKLHAGKSATQATQGEP
jgi:iron complex transport system substrate-binding protein